MRAGSHGAAKPIGLVMAALAIALAAPAAASAKDDTVWLCKPGIADNPCKPGLSTTQMSPSGAVLGTTSPKAVKRPRVDCFYVYPTVSDDQTPNSDLSIDPEERSIALFQAARYSQHCRVFAPMYRQLTLDAIFDPGAITEEMRAIAYGDVVDAWRTYLREYNRGRGVILIGHSQGTFVLRQLVRQYIDRRPAVRERLVSALLLGGNVEVAEGKDAGGDFRHVPGCRTARQLGCAIAYSTYGETPPPDAAFGRVGGALSSGDPATRDVLCTNPAALGGGPGNLSSIYPSAPFAPGTTIGLATEAVGVPRPEVSTTWVESKADYSAQCVTANEANVLLISPLAGAPTLNPLPDATWGLHLTDANIALGNLIEVVRRQIKLYAGSGAGR